MTSGPRDREIAHYVKRTVYPYSAHYRAVLDGAGVGARVHGRADLARIPPTDLHEVVDPAPLVLRPDLGRIMRNGRLSLAAWGAAARVAGGMPAFSRHVERRFKPVLWVLADGVPIGYSADDVSRLARRGAAWLERAGVTARDVVVGTVEPGPSTAYWQLVLGCRRAGVSALHLGPGAEAAAVARLAPSVIAGDPVRLTALLSDARREGRALAHLRTVLAVGPPLGGERRARLQDLAPGAAVVAAWAPPGVRAIWAECRAGVGGPVPVGYHAWQDDVLEGGANGELLWTGVRWGGTALLRLRTFAVARVTDGACPACGAPGPLVMPHAPLPFAPGAQRSAAGAPSSGSAPQGDGPQPSDGGPPDTLAEGVGAPAGAPWPARPEDVLRQDAEVTAWLVEYRTVDGSLEATVTLAPAPGVNAASLVERLGQRLGGTQFVVCSPEEVEARVTAAGGAHVIGPLA